MFLLAASAVASLAILLGKKKKEREKTLFEYREEVRSKIVIRKDGYAVFSDTLIRCQNDCQRRRNCDQPFVLKVPGYPEYVFYCICIDCGRLSFDSAEGPGIKSFEQRNQNGLVPSRRRISGPRLAGSCANGHDFTGESTGSAQITFHRYNFSGIERSSSGRKRYIFKGVVCNTTRGVEIEAPIHECSRCNLMVSMAFLTEDNLKDLFKKHRLPWLQEILALSSQQVRTFQNVAPYPANQYQEADLKEWRDDLMFSFASRLGSDMPEALISKIKEGSAEELEAFGKLFEQIELISAILQNCNCNEGGDIHYFIPIPCQSNLLEHDYLQTSFGREEQIHQQQSSRRLLGLYRQTNIQYHSDINHQDESSVMASMSQHHSFYLYCVICGQRN